ncbi:hypothetical protein GH714_025061 [Hevea brasiliensis]|uniref:SAND domain-containing protein n=2 Tax=Hevea brasiliensis TaxID=3981 RepID=A0A6A6MPF8_HEVBR|nr:hypothetical protein GH714_025061 [Hevea brasiliensis]
MEIEVRISEALFPENELKDMVGFKRGPDYVEVKCGCTSRKYGDAIGNLRVHASGQFLITCDCTPGCREKRFTPYDFEKHSGKEGRIKWPSHLWVLMNDKKVPLRKTPLLKYYKHVANGASGSMRRIRHRDEFIQCSRCKKERRFRLRTKEECRIYHDAALKKKWKCADRPYDKKITSEISRDFPEQPIDNGNIKPTLSDDEPPPAQAYVPHLEDTVSVVSISNLNSLPLFDVAENGAGITDHNRLIS